MRIPLSVSFSFFGYFFLNIDSFDAGKFKPVIKKAMVELEGRKFKHTVPLMSLTIDYSS